MVELQPYERADEQTLVDGCALGDPDAFRALRARFGRTVDLVAARALDERFAGEVESHATLRDATFAYLEANRAAPMRVYGGRSLPHFLSTTTRRVARERIPGEVDDRPLVATAHTPSGVDTLPPESADWASVGAALERLPADATCVLRLRARGLERRQIAAALGRTEASIQDRISVLAQHLARGLPNGVESWRFLLDGMTPAERTGLAIRSKDDERFRRHRAEAETIFRGVVDHAQAGSRAQLPMCLDHHMLARWADGSLAGDDRSWAEGHVVGCARCTDALAMLVLDVEAMQELRLWDTDDDLDVALAAGCVASARFLAGQAFAERSQTPRATLLQRIARVGRNLTSSRAEKRPTTLAPPPIATSRRLPDDDEAPIYAFEELAQGNASAAHAALDEHLRKSALGTRLQMLSAAAGVDPDLGRALAFDATERARVDPRLLEDAQAVLALPDAVRLPREILRERLLRLVPDLVRHLRVTR